MERLYQTAPQNTTKSNGISFLQSAAISYVNAGFSIIPINKNKQPMISTWAQYQRSRPATRDVVHWFNSSIPHGIAIIAGRISENLEVLDIDCKYDLTG